MGTDGVTFDSYACSYCGLARSQHTTKDDGAIEYCADGKVYWPHREIRSSQASARSKFIREATLGAVRSGVRVADPAVWFGRLWDSMEEENERYFREWRPKQ